MADEVQEKPGETPTPKAGETQAEAQPAANAAELANQLAELQKQLRAVNRESAERRKALEAFEKAETERRQAEMTEAQRLQAEIETLRRERAEAQAAAQAATIRAAVTAKAAGRFHDPEDVFLALSGRLKVNEAGEVEGLDDELKALAQAKPHWVKAAAQTIRPTTPSNGQMSAGETAAERRRRLIG